MSNSESVCRNGGARLKVKPAKENAKDCGCFEKVQARLKEQGIAMDSQLMMNMKTGKSWLAGPLIKYGKINPKNRKAANGPLLCTFCPFCGEKLP